MNLNLVFKHKSWLLTLTFLGDGKSKEKGGQWQEQGRNKSQIRSLHKETQDHGTRNEEVSSYILTIFTSLFCRKIHHFMISHLLS